MIFLTQLVIDANVLGDVCRDKDNARGVLDIIRKRGLTVIFCTEISKEYKSIFKHPDCKKQGEILRKWYEIMISKSGFGKKVRIESVTVNRCFSGLIKRKKFTEKDMVYVKAAEKIKGDNKILIAYEWHFRNADSCIEKLGIRRLDLDSAVEFLDAM